MKNHIVIVAGGKGVRMGAEIPKQFLPLRGLPLLMHTIRLFHHHPSVHEAPIVVLPADQITMWQRLCQDHNFSTPHQLTEGGATRFESVKKGLDLVPDGAIVGIHDGVRPLVSDTVIANTYHLAYKNGAAIPVMTPPETIRKLDKDRKKSYAVNRSDYVVVQTPQVFKSRLIKQAYQASPLTEFTDDASVVEYAGYPIYLSEGNRENIKITTPFDLLLAENFLRENKKTG